VFRHTALDALTQCVLILILADTGKCIAGPIRKHRLGGVLHACFSSIDLIDQF
jgi:hypothetical protein